MFGLRLRIIFMKPSVVLTLAWLAFAGWVHAQAVNPALPTIPAGNFNVTSYGAVGDGKTDNTAAITSAINAAAVNGGTVEFPAATNTYLSSSFTLYSSIRLQVDAGAELQMLPYGTYAGNTTEFIYCNNVHDLEICGGGTIDGQGSTWWHIAPGTPPLLLDLFSCDRLFIHDITFQNSPYHHCGIRDNGGNITISNLTEYAPSNSPNTDGLDFVGTNCLIENCHINVGDDNIAMGATGPLIGLVISNCAFGTGHGTSIGSSISYGITNLTVINCSYNGTVNGIRMKCNQDASAPIKNLNYLNLSMTNVGLPIVIWTYYNITETPTAVTTATVLNTTPSNINSTTPNWSDITISNLNIISGSSSDIGGIIWGPTEWPISNLTLVCITNNAPNTFDLYNVYGVQIINSQFNFNAGATTFTLCNAGVTISNTAPVSRVETIGGAASANSLALYNAAVSMSSTTNLFAANPITISGSVLTNTTSLTLLGSTAQNFCLGTNSSTIAVTGNLTLDSTLNIAGAGGFTATNYTLFTYTGSLSGQPVLGATPAGYTCVLNTNTAGKVLLVVSSSASALQVVLPGQTGGAGPVSGSPNEQIVGDAFSVTINAVNASGDIVTNDSSTVVNFSSSDTAASLPANGSTTLVNGTATVNVTLKTAGSQTVTASDAAGILTSCQSSSVTVLKATPTLTTAPTASAITYGQALSASTLSGGVASVAGSFAFTTPTATPGVGTANQSVTFTPTNSTDYTTLVFNVSVTVNRATPTLTTAPTASAITVGQALSASTLTGGSASVPGSFAFTTPTATPGVGTANQSVTFTPTNNTDYNTLIFNVSVTVLPPPTITSVGISGTSLTINGINGVVGTYYVLMSTNLATPLSSWTSVESFSLTSSGSFSQIVTNAVNTGDSAQFYILRAP
jgi:uncharacterized protein YccT (UPF0319 family)